MIPNRGAKPGEAARRERRRLERRMDGIRHVEFLKLREDRIEIPMPMRLALMIERRDECAFASVLDRALQLHTRRRYIAQRDMRDRNEPSAGISAEVRNPSIVGAAIGVAEFGVFDFRFPEQPDGRIENRLVDAVLIQQLKALL